MARNNLHRLRDLGRLSLELGFNVQPLRFAWHLVRGRRSRANEITFTLRSLDGGKIHVRPGTSDLIVLYEAFGATYDAPPGMLRTDRVRRVWDLGANIGLTMARYAMAFPDAHITGVELDADNAAQAVRNVAMFASRCQVLHGAVWFEDGSVDYVLERSKEHGARVTDGVEAVPSGALRAPAFSLNTLLGDAVVDYMKMDIEGAEAHVLKRNTQWARNVRVIRVECHGAYSAQAASDDLKRLGFETQECSSHWAAVLGWRM